MVPKMKYLWNGARPHIVTNHIHTAHTWTTSKQCKNYDAVIVALMCA